MPHVFTRTVSDPDQGPASSSHSGHVAAARWSRAELELERDGGMGAWGGGTGGHAPAVQSRPRRPPRVPADTRAPTSSPSLCRKLLPKTTQVAGWTPPPSWPPGRALRRRRGPRPGAAAHGPRGRPASHLTPCPSQRPTRPPSTPRVRRTSAGKPTWGRWGPLPRPWGPLTSRGSKCRLVLYRKRKSGSMRVCGFPGPQINKTTSAGTQQPALCWPRAERSVLARVLPPPSSWARGRAPRRTRLGDFSRGTESKGQVRPEPGAHKPCTLTHSACRLPRSPHVESGPRCSQPGRDRGLAWSAARTTGPGSPGSLSRRPWISKFRCTDVC